METFRDHLHRAQVCKCKLDKFKKAQEELLQEERESETKQENANVETPLSSNIDEKEQEGEEREEEEEGDGKLARIDEEKSYEDAENDDDGEIPTEQDKGEVECENSLANMMNDCHELDDAYHEYDISATQQAHQQNDNHSLNIQNADNSTVLHAVNEFSSQTHSVPNSSQPEIEKNADIDKEFPSNMRRTNRKNRRNRSRKQNKEN